MIACPICGKPAAPRDKNAGFPFCSPRCKMVDLGKWLNEEYRAPAIEAPTDGIGDAEPAVGPAKRENN
jgi:endogenous inhibitor of DNA gyrase (YacG/DUF329 family)